MYSWNLRSMKLWARIGLLTAVALPVTLLAGGCPITNTGQADSATIAEQIEEQLSARLIPLEQATATGFKLSGENTVYIDAGNVGIGTDDPRSKLHVVGSMQVDVAGVTRLMVDPTTGNVGIGTSSPTDALSIDGAAKISDGLTVAGGLKVGTTDDADFVDVNATKAANLRLKPTDGSADPNDLDHISAKLALRDADDAGVDSIIEGNANVFRIRPIDPGGLPVADAANVEITAISIKYGGPNQGSVGIGTADPTKALDVSGISPTIRIKPSQPTEPNKVSARLALREFKDVGADLVLDSSAEVFKVVQIAADGVEVAKPLFAISYKGTGVGNVGFGTEPDETKPIKVGRAASGGDPGTPGQGAFLSEAGVWTDTSSRKLKENFQAASVREILAKVVALPVQTWNYKIQNESVRHLGPVAEDFHAMFNLGDSDKHIAALDTSGVALAAIQGLNEIVQEKDAAIALLEERLAALEALVQQMSEAQSNK